MSVALKLQPNGCDSFASSTWASDLGDAHGMSSSLGGSLPAEPQEDPTALVAALMSLAAIVSARPSPAP